MHACLKKRANTVCTIGWHCARHGAGPVCIVRIFISLAYGLSIFSPLLHRAGLCGVRKWEEVKTSLS